MQFTKERPTKVGTQFIAVYVYEDKLWSDCIKINSEGLYQYNSDTDTYNPIDEDWFGWYENKTTKYVIL